MKLTILSVLFSLISLFAYAQTDDDDNQRHIDSLCNILPTLPLNIDKLKVEWEIVNDSEDYDVFCKYLPIFYDDAISLGNKEYELYAISSRTRLHYFNGEFEQGIESAYKSLALADSLNNKRYQMGAYSHLSVLYSALKDRVNTIEYMRKSITLAQELGDSASLSLFISNIAQEYYDRYAYKQSAYYFNQAANLDSLANNSETYYRLKLFAEISNAFQAVEEHDYTAFRTSKNKVFQYFHYVPNPEMESACTTVPDLLLREILVFSPDENSRKNILDSCRQYMQIVYPNNMSYSEYASFGMSATLIDYYTLAGNQTAAIHIIDSLNTVVSDNNYTDSRLATVLTAYAKYYEMFGNSLKQAYYLKQLLDIVQKDNADYAAESTKAIAQIEYENIIRKREQEAMKREGALEAESRWRSVIIVLLLIVGLLIARSYFRGKKTNKKLNIQNDQLLEQREEILTQNEELEKQKNIIADKNEQITDSINYASLIQQAALPSESQMNTLFPDNFVLYHPLDIVSGDFYWVSQAGNLKMLAVADCTGHGVPGAFVSMLGISLLSDAAKAVDVNSVSAGAVLDQLRDSFKRALRQNGGKSDNRDGIDMAMIIVDSQKNTLHYAGAFRPLILFHNGEMTKVDADRMPIGVYHSEETNFTDNVFQLSEGDTLYLFSDGLTDQFGYDENGFVRKFSRKRLKSLLARVNTLPMDAQKAEIDSAILKWRKHTDGSLYEQTDDALMVALRV